MLWGCQHDQIIKFIGEEAQIGHNDRNLTNSSSLSGQNELDKMIEMQDEDGKKLFETYRENNPLGAAYVVEVKDAKEIDAVADKLIDDRNKSINIERKNNRGKEYLIMKTTSTEVNLDLSPEELMDRVKGRPYTKTIPFVDENGLMSITTEVTDKIK